MPFPSARCASGLRRCGFADGGREMRLHTMFAYLAVGSCAWSGSAFAAFDFTVYTSASVAAAVETPGGNYASGPLNVDSAVKLLSTSTATYTFSFPEGYASATATSVADSGNGVLKIGHFATASGTGLASAGGSAYIADVLYFDFIGAATSGTFGASMHVEGDISTPVKTDYLSGYTNSFDAELNLLTESAGINPWYSRANAYIALGYGESISETNSVCTMVDTHFACDLRFSLLVFENVPYNYSANVSGSVTADIEGLTLSPDEQFLNAMQTATIDFVLPAGASFSSQSGLLLSTRQDGNIPEPATLALFGLGLAGLGTVRRKKLGVLALEKIGRLRGPLPRQYCGICEA
jgi:hypothetical protein